MNVESLGAWARQRNVIAGLAAVLALVALLLTNGTMALAQADTFKPGTLLRVANTDGQSLNLRAGPSTDQPVVTKLTAGDVLAVIGQSRLVGATRWLPVHTTGGQSGWVAADYVVVVSTPVPTPARAADATPTPARTDASAERERDGEKGKPVEVEAKLKYPEVKGRDQEITVWVTRNGAPVPGASVTLETSDGDEEEHFRQLDPTNDEGWTRRKFDVRQEKGTVELRVEAVAPDGGEGQTIASYFRR